MAWCGVGTALLAASFFFGNLPWIGDHLTVVLLGIVVVSSMPGLVEPGKVYRQLVQGDLYT